MKTLHNYPKNLATETAYEPSVQTPHASPTESLWLVLYSARSQQAGRPASQPATRCQPDDSRPPNETKKQKQKNAAAAKLAKELRSANPLSHGVPQTSHEAGAAQFVSSFFQASRLHFIGMWRSRFEELTADMPAAPDLPEALPDGERVVFHADMDAFFSTVAALGRPELKNVPLAVSWGGAGGDAEISSCNYLARSFGVRANMWLKQARELCPALVSVPFEFERYADLAELAYKEYFSLTPHVEGLSCDEAYLDVTHLVAAPGGPSPRELAETLRQRVLDATGGCTVSVGIGPNRFVARVATKRAKPNGVAQLESAGLLGVLGELPVSQLPGVGRKTTKRLARLGVTTCAHLQLRTMNMLQREFGAKVGKALFELCRGIDSRRWDPRPARKSVSAQISYGVRMSEHEEVHQFISELAGEVEKRLERAGFARGGNTVGIKIWRAVENAPEHMRKGTIGHGICTYLNRSARIPGGPIREAGRIAQEAFKLYGELAIRADEVRGIGVSVSDLAQLSVAGSAFASFGVARAGGSRAAVSSDLPPTATEAAWGAEDHKLPGALPSPTKRYIAPSKRSAPRQISYEAASKRSSTGMFYWGERHAKKWGTQVVRDGDDPVRPSEVSGSSADRTATDWRASSGVDSSAREEPSALAGLLDAQQGGASMLQLSGGPQRPTVRELQAVMQLELCFAFEEVHGPDLNTTVSLIDDALSVCLVLLRECMSALGTDADKQALGWSVVFFVERWNPSVLPATHPLCTCRLWENFARQLRALVRGAPGLGES